MISKSVGVVFVDCDKCNPDCELQRQIGQYKESILWKPFALIKGYTIHTRPIEGIEKITKNAQLFYDLACKICHNCKERQK